MSERAMDYDDPISPILSANSFATLATADRYGRPWATPVWYACTDAAELLWVSDPGARHSQNIEARPEIALVVFDSTVEPEQAEAAYFEAFAAEVPDDELDACVAVYSRRSQERGLRAWTPDDVRAPEPLRLYRARITARFVLQDGNRRARV